MTLPYANSATKGMMIHNGDHAEFELEHLNTPPEERPDWMRGYDQKGNLFDQNGRLIGWKSDRGQTWLLGWIVCSGFVLAVAALIWAVR